MIVILTVINAHQRLDLSDVFKYVVYLWMLLLPLVGNELVHAGSHARPQEVDRGMPSQGGSTD